MKLFIKFLFYPICCFKEHLELLLIHYVTLLIKDKLLNLVAFFHGRNIIPAILALSDMPQFISVRCYLTIQLSLIY